MFTLERLRLGRRPQLLGWALLCTLGLPLLPSADAAYTFTKIADTSTTAPGSGVPFSTFSDICYDGANIAFIGRTGGTSGPEAIYQWNGSTLSRVVNAGEPVPSSAQSFVNFQNLSLDAGRIVFQASNSHDFQQSTFEGVYTNLGGSLRRVVDSTMTMPGSTAVFRDLAGFGVPSFDVAIGGNTIAFSGFGSLGGVFEEGVYRETAGVLSVVANRSTVLPGKTAPETFYRGEIDVDDGHILIGPDGVYTTHNAPAGSSLRKIFDRNSTLPELTPPLTIFSPNTFSFDNGQTAFVANHGTNFETYLYLETNGSYRKIVDENDMNPVTGTPFVTIDQHYSLSNGRVLFSGWSNFSGESVESLYLSNDAGFEPIMSDLDTLDGKNLTGFSLYKESLIDGNFAFQATFNDGSSGIYLAKEEPTGTPQMLSIEPTFDVQLRPGNQYPIGDGMTTLVIDGGAGTSFPVLQVLAEFPLNGIPEGAQITSAQLKLDATSSGSSNLTINAAGYAGDGLASLSDEFIATTLLGSKTGPFTATGDVTINLDANVIESLLSGGASHLGLRLASATTGPFINIASIESTTGAAPTLVVSFTTSATGDFDFDMDVDGNDFLLWQRGVGAQYDQTHLAAWQTAFGTAASSVAASSLPEPALAPMLLAGLAAAGVTPLLRKVHHRSS
jgi:hypothetical protein